MKTPPPNLPPIPEGFTYIGVDDGSLIEEGCLNQHIRVADCGFWHEGRVDGAPPCNLPIAAPTGSLLHMLNSVPDGFDYYGKGPLKSISDTCDHDVALFTPSEGWTTRWSGVGGHHYALRSGSPIALANGLVPVTGTAAPAPAVEPGVKEWHREHPEEPLLAPLTYPSSTPGFIDVVEPGPRYEFRRVDGTPPMPFHGQPDKCPVCNWTNQGLVNYGTLEQSKWLCHGCATREMAAARMLLDAFAEQVKTLKQRLEREEMCHAACGVIANANTRESLANARDMHPRYHSGSVGDCIAATEREINLREERDEMKRALAAAQSGNRSLADEVDALKKSRDEHHAACGTWQEAFKQIGKHLGLGGTTGNAFTAVAEARKLREERDSLRTELARVHETLRTFYAAAEAMAKEAAK